MSCKYCIGSETIIEIEVPLTQISIEKGSLIAIDMFGVAEQKINFCPMCGCNLKEGDTNAAKGKIRTTLQCTQRQSTAQTHTGQHGHAGNGDGQGGQDKEEGTFDCEVKIYEEQTGG